MNRQQVELYRRVKSFRFDADGTSHTFARRLAEESGWTPDYTLRVIEEYRRFAFLAAAAGHPVSPSDPVDQAWHLHLVYTRSYWDEFCGKVLRTPLHHEPSKGGRSERVKFDDWYGRTLDSYRRFFAEDPPADLWPGAHTKPERAPSYRRVNVARSWVVPRPRIRVVASAIGVALTLAAVAIGCGRRSLEDPAFGNKAATYALNPFDLRGPQFLAFYGVAFVISLVAAWNIRAAARGPADMPPSLNLDPYQIAYLNGGAVHATNAAITALCHRDVIDVRASDASVGVLQPAATLDHPLEQSVHYAAGGGIRNRRPARKTLRAVRAATRPTVDQMAEGLKRAGLLVTDAHATAAVACTTLLALVVPTAGVVKIGVGIARDKPVAYLIVTCLMTTVIALAFFTRRPHRTRRGDAALRSLRSRHYQLEASPVREAPESLNLGVALFGLSILKQTDLAFLKKTLRPKDAPASSSQGCGGSSCGAGSASGGGFCGGGSACGGSSGCGGGGGCGGCGGS